MNITILLKQSIMNVLLESIKIPYVEASRCSSMKVQKFNMTYLHEIIELLVYSIVLQI